MLKSINVRFNCFSFVMTNNVPTKGVKISQDKEFPKVKEENRFQPVKDQNGWYANAVKNPNIWQANTVASTENQKNPVNNSPVYPHQPYMNRASMRKKGNPLWDKSNSKKFRHEHTVPDMPCGGNCDHCGHIGPEWEVCLHCTASGVFGLEKDCKVLQKGFCRQCKKEGNVGYFCAYCEANIDGFYIKIELFLIDTPEEISDIRVVDITDD